MYIRIIGVFVVDLTTGKQSAQLLGNKREVRCFLPIKNILYVGVKDRTESLEENVGMWAIDLSTASPQPVDIGDWEVCAMTLNSKETQMAATYCETVNGNFWFQVHLFGVDKTGAITHQQRIGDDGWGEVRFSDDDTKVIIDNTEYLIPSQYLISHDDDPNEERNNLVKSQEGIEAEVSTLGKRMSAEDECRDFDGGSSGSGGGERQLSTKKKRRKRKASTNALREIRKEQKRTHNIIPVAPFNRLVQELSEKYKSGLRFKSQAYSAFHTAAEDYLISIFTDANKIAIHSRRETVQPKDIRLAYQRVNQ